MRPFKKVFVQARKELQEILSAFEFMDNTSQKLTAKHLGLEHPIESGDFPFYVLVKPLAPTKSTTTKIGNILGNAMEEGLVDDGLLHKMRLKYNHYGHGENPFLKQPLLEAVFTSMTFLFHWQIFAG